ncbi:MAG: SsrA-binding protein [Oscillospiraceae bacterium]|nr:SsrA-binding protein [Oscillospiraceae bacterium]
MIYVVRRQGFSLILVSSYFKRKWVKLELGLCKGKKHTINVNQRPKKIHGAT